MKTLAIAALVGGGLLSGTVGGVFLLHRGAVGSQVPQSCVVGVSGSAAQMQATGSGAVGECDNFRSGVSGSYSFSGAPSGTVLCQYHYPAQHYVVTVFDTGVFDTVGGAMCSHLLEFLAARGGY